MQFVARLTQLPYVTSTTLLPQGTADRPSQSNTLCSMPLLYQHYASAHIQNNQECKLKCYSCSFEGGIPFIFLKLLLKAARSVKFSSVAMLAQV